MAGYYDEVTGAWVDLGDDAAGYSQLDNTSGTADMTGWEYAGNNVWTTPEGSSVDLSYLSNTQTPLDTSQVSQVSGLQNLWKSITGGSGTTSQMATLLPLLYGLSAASQSNVRTQPAGYQGGIPRLVATRQAPAPGQKISGNVTYTAKAEGGELESGGFVIPADVVSHLGNGSSEAGLKVLARSIGATPIKGDGDGMSDSIPTTIDGAQKALVANEEAYLSPEKVERLGGGDAEKGAKRLRDMMARIRQARTGSEEQGKQINPAKFMPGGEVRRFVDGDTVTKAAPAGTTGIDQSLANWAGPYVTEMLGKGQALSEMPYEQYTGKLTAGPSALQTQAFTQASQGLATPYTAVGAEFTAPGTAEQYMNPFLKAALEPQMAELKRQSDIKRMEDASRLTKAGAFGGSRQAVMESEGARNLLDLQRKALGEGYATAYDKAMAQFNADQARKVQEAQFGTTAEQQGIKTLADLGATQRGIEAEATAAEKAQFEEARLNPYKMVQFQQSLLSGLPLAAYTYNQQPTSNLTQFAQGFTGLQQALASLGIKTA